MDLTLAIFFLVYLVMGLGYLPGLRLDRTGAAMVGAMILIAAGRISPPDAWNAIDFNTIGLLFGLMVISATFAVAGFYEWVARRIGALEVGPHALLALLIVVATVMSSLLTKDIVAVAMTPVFCSICLARRLNPVPFLLGFCFATNIGSAGMLTGSPQNMIAAELLHLSFTGFMRAAAVPALLGLPLIWLVLVLFYRGRWHLADGPQPAPPPAPQPPQAVALDRIETAKAAVVLSAVIVAFVTTDWPHMLVALAGASLLLISPRVSSNSILHRLDGNLLLLLFGLFIVNATFAAAGVPQQLLESLRGYGLDLHDPLSLLLVMAVLSNIVGNNPAVMLVAPFVAGADQAEALGAAIALGTGFSSNAILSGSLAGIIMAEAAQKRGVAITFKDFAKVGAPLAALSLVGAAGWILVISR
ncbi:SLC13 family permease [Roseomonas fluvialis]|uniref:Transporter n=1 Tax=Roseomonas fluvialis TaxID=1750527 RepID=A0ABN6P775_9PROT|nr:SLC13 family permease [Roseomonas fluvialis]BDG73504.1 transporter [Roseomonas fluvialis]